MVSVISGVATRTEKWTKVIRKELNFYRIHLIIFTLTPLFFSIILYLSNGRYKISYIDSLFNCVSAMAVCGLATVDLSTLTPWQQVIMFMQMCIGSPIVASWIMVFNRRRYIRKHCSRIFTEFVEKKQSEAQNRGKWRKLLHRLGIPSPTPSIEPDEENSSDKYASWSRSGTPHRVRPDMIRRMDDRPMLINPSGLVTGETPDVKVSEPTPADETTTSPTLPVPPSLSRHRTISSGPYEEKRIEDPKGTSPGLPRTMTVEFANNLPRPRLRVAPTITEQNMSDSGDRASRHFPTNVSLSNHPTHQSARTHRSFAKAKNQGYGGFPMPLAILKRLFRKAFPNLNQKITRTLTIPVTTSLVSVPTRQPHERHAPYVRDSIRMGRNSQFDLLSMNEDDLIQIAYMEYQALGLLLWVIPLYHFGCQLIGFAVIAPYMSMSRWQSDLVPPALQRPVNSVWFSTFQTVSAYTNTGMSLVDTSMVPFQRAYPMIFVMIALILAGNTCFPIFLRLFIYGIMKLSKPDTDLRNVTQFLLDHPRRCFLYLFPSHQTWFLLTVVLFLTFLDWGFFLILDLGNEVIASIPTGVRVLAGFMQSIAVRAAGFGIVPLAALAPAVKVLYVIMMYISIYPIAMSIRSTNVYEEKSLGIFHHSEDGEETFKPEGQSRVTVWSRYLAMHARQQLAFDMWWIAISLFLLCITESSNINDPEKGGWFSIFNILFDVVSAYGTVGLSLGSPMNNYSFSGSFRPISKLIVCAVIIRGRHRGLPVAIDRAVMFPSEYQDKKREEQPEDDESDLEYHLDQERATQASGRGPSMNPSPSIQFVSEPLPDPTLEKGFRHPQTYIRRSLSRRRSGVSVNDTASDPGVQTRHIPFSLASQLAAIPQGNSKPNSVTSWRNNVKQGEGEEDGSVRSYHGEDDATSSYHRSDSASRHEREDP